MSRQAVLSAALVCVCLHGCALGASDDFVIDDRAQHCENAVTDADETDVDCGGADCASCASDCGPADPCATGVCVAGRCEPPESTCDDGVANGSETDVDCGGPCAKCGDGRACEDASDCQSGKCGKKVCKED